MILLVAYGNYLILLEDQGAQARQVSHLLLWRLEHRADHQNHPCHPDHLNHRVLVHQEPHPQHHDHQHPAGQQDQQGQAAQVLHHDTHSQVQISAN